MTADLADRTAQIAARARAAQPAKPRDEPAQLKPEQLASLHATCDRERPVATWYRVSKPDCEPIDVAFNPEVTIQEAQAWYPGATVNAP